MFVVCMGISVVMRFDLLWSLRFNFYNKSVPQCTFIVLYFEFLILLSTNVLCYVGVYVFPLY